MNCRCDEDAREDCVQPIGEIFAPREIFLAPFERAITVFARSCTGFHAASAAHALPQRDAMTLCETEKLVETSLTEAPQAVLVVDADSGRLARIRERLTASGLAVRTATDVTAAQAFVTEGWPDVILIDLDLQELDGYSLATLFRCEAPLVGVAIVLVTSRQVDEDDRQLAAAAGAQALIERSETFERELDAICRLLRGEGGYRDANLRPSPHVRRLAGQVGQRAGGRRALRQRAGQHPGCLHHAES
jgi:CheY-like chemotaxis protein